MQTAYAVPLQASNQTVQISLAGLTYQITVRWNATNEAWQFDLQDSSGNYILAGIPIVTGMDLLSPFAYLNLGGQLIAQTSNDTDAVPTFDNLGSGSTLYFVVG